MALPRYIAKFLDGQQGVRQAISGDVPVIMGTSSAGTAAVPKLYAPNSVSQIVTDLGYGPMPQLLALLSALGLFAIGIKTPSTSVGTQSAVTFVGTGTSVITTTGASRDDYEFTMTVITGGTIGVAGITFKYSLDNGRTYAPTVTLGIANTYAIPNTGISLAFAAGTLVAADKATFLGTAPKWGSSDITAGVSALIASNLTYSWIHLVGPCNATEAATVKTNLTTLEGQYAYKFALLETVKQTSAQTDAQWQTTITTDWVNFTSLRIGTFAGTDKISSPIDGYNYMRPSTWEATVRCALVDAGVDLAQVASGPVLGSIHDSQGNLVAHDERVQPGLDDARFGTLCTIVGENGVFIGNPKLMAPAGSDYDLLQFRRVMDKASDIAYAIARKQLSRGVRVDKKTGFILEKDARGIEALVNTALEQEITDRGRASRANFVLNRNDNILSTRKVTGKTRVVSLGYIKEFETELAFENPAAKVL
jgi:hypothetical protein